MIFNYGDAPHMRGQDERQDGGLEVTVKVINVEINDPIVEQVAETQQERPEANPAGYEPYTADQLEQMYKMWNTRIP